MTIALKFSGGAANSDPAASIGGAISSVDATGALFALSHLQFQLGVQLYRCVYVSTSLAKDALKVWIHSDTPATETTIALGWGAATVNTTETAIADQTTAPAGVSFSSPYNSVDAPSGGDFAAADYRALWIRYTAVAGSTPQVEQFTLEVDDDGQLYEFDFNKAKNSMYIPILLGF